MPQATTARPPIQNKPLLIAVIVVAIVIAASVATVASHMGLTRDQALERATGLMQTTCTQSCDAHGLAAAALQGPEDGPYNHIHNNTKYEFKWRVAGNPEVIVVRVWDNGLWVQTKARWINEKTDKPW